MPAAGSAQEALQQWISSGGGDKGQYWDPMDLEMRGLQGISSPEAALRQIQSRYDFANKRNAQTSPAPVASATSASEPLDSSAGAGSGGGGGAGAKGGGDSSLPASLRALASMASGSSGGGTEQEPIEGEEALRPGLGKRLLPQYHGSLAALQRAIY